jgi:hypothetical protein
MARSTTVIYSIFGQIESVAAQVLVDDGTATKIEARMIPDSALYNDHGDVALFAIVLPRNAVERFENLIRDLRA